ncbi:MAG: J domain-containing protein [Chloroflexota bacterium]
MADPIDPYKVLQVDPEAEDEVIQAAYRRLARKYHPDLAATPDASDRMVAINAAWKLIGDPAARQAFDRKRLALKTAPASPAPGDGSGSSGASGASGPSGESGSSTSGAPSSARPGAHASGSQRAKEPPSSSSRPPETVSRDWTSGRSSQGSGYDESMRAADGFGAAGPPPGNPTGTVLNFGRYAGWSLGEVSRVDLEYIEWLDRAPIGRNYRQEIDELLRKTGRRKSAEADATDRRGLFRRR